MKRVGLPSIAMAISLAACEPSVRSAGPVDAHEIVTTYPAPPLGLSPPLNFTPEAVSAAQGHLAKWAKELRTKLGPFESDESYYRRRNLGQIANGEKRSGTRLPNVSGFFLLLPSDKMGLIAPGAIFEGGWSGDEYLFADRLRFIQGKKGCSTDFDPYLIPKTPDMFVYLGQRWQPEWSNLITAFGKGFVADTRPAISEADVTWISRPKESEIKRFGDFELSGSKAADWSKASAVSLCRIQADGHLDCIYSTEQSAPASTYGPMLGLYPTYRAAPLLNNGDASAGRCVKVKVDFERRS